MTNTPPNQSVIVMTGMHRSGTSLTASSLQNAGINIGDRLMGGDTGNTKGHFEDLDFVEFHQNVLQSQGISVAGWTEHDSIEVQQQYVAPARDLIRARQDKAVWGWKDPRTTLFLDFWSELIPQAKYIFIYRSPWEVVDSLFRRGDIIFQTNPNFAVKQWCRYNQLILDFYERHPEQCLLLGIESVINNSNLPIDLVKQKWNLELKSPKSVYDSGLFTAHDNQYRQALITKFFPNAIALYDKLQNIGDCPNDSTNEALAPDETCQSWILQDWIDAKQASRAKKQIESQINQSQQKSEAANTELAQARQQLEAANTELTQAHQS